MVDRFRLVLWVSLSLDTVFSSNLDIFQESVLSLGWRLQCKSELYIRVPQTLTVIEVPNQNAVTISMVRDSDAVNWTSDLVMGSKFASDSFPLAYKNFNQVRICF